MWFRRRRGDAMRVARLEAEVAAQRAIIADLGRRLLAAQRDALGNTVPLPRVRSQGAHVRGQKRPEGVGCPPAVGVRQETPPAPAWPPKEWTT